MFTFNRLTLRTRFTRARFNFLRLIEPIEFIPRIGGLGLGATPRAPPPEKKDRIKKPGEEPKKVLGPYVDKDGRVKHVKKIGEEIPQQPLQGVDVYVDTLIYCGLL